MENKRIVVKIGTSTLAHPSGLLNIRRVEELCRVLSDLKNAGHEIILVSSGAIGMGAGKLSLPHRPEDTPTKQAAAAVGQCELMYTYDKAFAEYNHTVAQILLTAADVDHPDRFQNFHNTMRRLLDLKALPIINENDTVATEEMGIGDNDTLAAVVAVSMEADLLILLSDIDGLYTADPHTHPEATLIAEIPALTREIWELAGGSAACPPSSRPRTFAPRPAVTWSLPMGPLPLYSMTSRTASPWAAASAERKDKTAMNLPPPSGEMPCYPPPAFSGHEFSASAAADPTELTITRPLLEEALAAKPALAALSTEEKKAVLLSMADALEADTPAILAANALDLAAAQDTISPVMQDRLRLTQGRIADMAAGVRAVAALPDPVGRTLASHTLPNGLQVNKASVPLGVIAIIYESRPNVTSDAASLTFQAGSVCVLRGGKESIHSNTAIVSALHKALTQHHLPTALVSLVTDTTRASANELMQAVGYIDLLIPRGGASLIQTCVNQAKVPCIQTGTGICHIYVDGDADLQKALSVVENAKTSRPSVCNAAEVCLVHRDIAPDFLPQLWDRLVVRRREAGQPPVELRLDPKAMEVLGRGIPAGYDDFDTEFLDYILAVRVVDSVEEAIAHINCHSTGHSEAILTQTRAHADLFTRLVDSAAVYVNASTRFTDGGQFGLGCEMGISTQKLHARGPMGLEELTSYKYVIHGDGQIR